MRFEYRILCALVIFAISSFTGNTVFGQTRLGLHVTQEELNIWKQRASSGPYRTVGDVRPNSPGDWNTILSNANQTLSSQRFAGYTGTGCVPNLSQGLGAVLPKGDYLRDAAFVYMVTGDTSYRSRVVTEFVAQVAQPGVNFGNTSKWCRDVDHSEGDDYFRPAIWATKLVYAYDYLKIGDQLYGQSLSIQDRTTIEIWITSAGLYFEAIANAQTGQVFVDRKNNNYSLTAQGANACATDEKVPYYGHSAIKRLNGLYFNNRRLTYVLVYALVGIQQNNFFLKTEAQRAFKEYIKYNVFQNGFVGSFKRWATGNPTYGLVYSFTAYGLMIQVADVFARAGDTSLYDYTTSEGLCGSAGGSKSLGFILGELAKYVDHTYLRYGTDQAGNNGNPSYAIDTVNNLASESWVFDHVLAQSNLYFQSDHLKSVYMRTASGQNGYAVPGYPAAPWHGGYYPWGGPWGNLPGVLFMFGQMEGMVSPHGRITSPRTLAAPIDLRVSQ
jgi:hypothetical protein